MAHASHLRLPAPLPALLTTDQWRRAHVGSLRAMTRRAVGNVVGNAVSNAGRALGDIADAVDDRRRMLVEPEDAAPGDLVVLPRARCLELLETRSTGRLGYIARAGVPDITPVNYLLRDGTVLIRSGPGPKLQAAERRDLVAFQVDDIDETAHTGWSVVVFGRAERLRPEQAAVLDLPSPWANGPRRHTLRITPARIDGRQLR